MTHQPVETMKAFNLRFMNLYRIPEVIRPHEHDTLIHYFNIIQPIYKNSIDEKVVDNIATNLQTFLEYEDHIQRTSLNIVETNKNSKMTTILQLMEDINNIMLSFERRVPLATINPTIPPTTQHAPLLPISTLSLPNSSASISPSPISSTTNIYLLYRCW